MSDFAPSEAEQARIANMPTEWCETCEGEHVCHECRGDGVVPYGGHPLDDFIDADPSRLVTCEECGGSGNDETPWGQQEERA